MRVFPPLFLAVAAFWPVAAQPGEPTARLTTDRGTVVLRLLPGHAPNTVANFVALARAGHYDGRAFYRLLPGFLVETGDPKDTGAGGPGWCLKPEISPQMRHDRPGLVSMVRYHGNSHGSRFMITLAKASLFDPDHTIFAEVTAGLGVLAEIAAQPVKAGLPVTPVRLQKVEIAGVTAAKEPERLVEADQPTIERLALPALHRALAGVGEAFGYGPPKRIKIARSWTRCREVRADFDVEFGGAKSLRASLQGQTREGALKVDRFMTAPAPVPVPGSR